MTRIERLTEKVRALYEKREETREEWADWLYQNHIFLVAKYGKELAEKYGASVDLVVAASLLHDIADAFMHRDNPEHEGASGNIAREFLRECSFTEDEIKIIIDDALEYHGCKNGNLPQIIEGKVMASADAMAHIRSDFYDFALSEKKKELPLDQIKGWALAKIERDYNNKIFFDEVREDLKADYERVKKLFLF